MLFPLLFVMNMARHLSDITLASVAGNLLIVCTVVIGIVYALKDGFGEKWLMISLDISLYPKFIGVVFFSMISPGIILTLEHNMKTPWNYTTFGGVLNSGMLIVTLIHILVGVTGYFKWGSDADGNFIKNHPDNDTATLFAMGMQALSIYFTYGLQCYIVISIITNQYVLPAFEENKWIGTPFLWDMVVRFFISLITCLLAASITKLDVFMGLVGSLCISTLTILIPITLYILVNYNNYGKFKWRLIAGLLLLIIGFAIACCASVVNLILIYRYFTDGRKADNFPGENGIVDEKKGMATKDKRMILAALTEGREGTMWQRKGPCEFSSLGTYSSLTCEKSKLAKRLSFRSRCRQRGTSLPLSRVCKTAFGYSAARAKDHFSGAVQVVPRAPN
ncbi:proton-coupled amino acid transporter-like protein acs [Andrena cerasifolii]|uniref:proton-coupled amino acid transporter-like protein acs n=1 Tax=Andrena cerasifolii TaxID=2819439 RepID=UPI0040379D4F